MKKQIKKDIKKQNEQNKANKNPISKNMSFHEIMEKNSEAIEILLGKGMHCIGCPMAMQETLEDGAIAHGLNPDKLVEEINEKLNKKEKTKKRNKEDEKEKK